MNALTEAVRAAMTGYDLVAVSTDVKDLICGELAKVDPTAEITRTDYFNHSYVPDIVVQWSGQSPREVFTRFVSDPIQLGEDLKRIGREGPVLFNLSTATDAVVGDIGDVPELNTALDNAPAVLLTDTEATEYVRPASAKNLVERLVAANVLRAGRGYLDEGAARAAVGLSRAGFDAALVAEPNAVRAAVAATQKIFGLELERRVERSLQLIWWAAGGNQNNSRSLCPTTWPSMLRTPENFCVRCYPTSS
jgi:hypothetical protein